MKLIHGDCIEKMKEIPANSIDMVMTVTPKPAEHEYGFIKYAIGKRR